MDVEPVGPVIGAVDMIIRRAADSGKEWVRHGLSRDQIQVIGTGEMALGAVEHTAGVVIMGADAAERICPVIHHVDKCPDAAGDMGGDGIARVVGRMNQSAVDQIFKGKGLSRLNVGVGGADVQPLENIGLGCHLVVQVHLSPLHSLHRQQAGHNLGETCDGMKLVLIQLIEDSVGIHVHHEGSVGTLKMGWIHRCKRRGGEKRNKKANCQKNGKNSLVFHRRSREM